MWLTLLTNKYVWVGIAFALVTGWGTYEKHRAEVCQEKHDTFVAQVRAAGLVAEAKAKSEELRFQKEKEKVSDELQKRLDSLAASNKRLRDERARSSILPAPTNPAVPTPERACAKWTDLERALSDFAREIEEYVEEGDRAAVIRDGWLRWWKGIEQIEKRSEERRVGKECRL